LYGNQRLVRLGNTEHWVEIIFMLNVGISMWIVFIIILPTLRVVWESFEYDQRIIKYVWTVRHLDAYAANKFTPGIFLKIIFISPPPP